MFLALFWCVICSFRLNMTRDIIKNLKSQFFIKCKICFFCIFILSKFFRLLMICLVISDLQEHAKPQIKAKPILFWPYFTIFCAAIDFLWDRKQKTFLIFFNQELTNRKNYRIWHFLKKIFFSYLIITLVIYDLKKPTIPHIKANDISFGPYIISFFGRINIFWDGKLWSCLIFFDSDFSTWLGKANSKILPNFQNVWICF